MTRTVIFANGTRCRVYSNEFFSTASIKNTFENSYGGITLVDQRGNYATVVGVKNRKRWLRDHGWN